jgi:hypothetical protein
MSSAKLKLFRRHDSRCTGFFNHKTRQQEPYSKENRIYEADTEKRKGRSSAVDCTCTIYAEGTLYRGDGSKNYLRPKATGKIGRPNPPNPLAVIRVGIESDRGLHIQNLNARFGQIPDEVAHYRKSV